MSNHSFNQISKHVHWLSPDSRTDRPVLGVVAGTHATLVVDAGNSSDHAHILLREIAARGIAPPSYVALTHWHWDHVFGTASLPVPTFAHIETRRVVAEMATQDWSDTALDQRVEQGVEIAFCRDMIRAELPDRSNLVIRPPDITFQDRVELDLGGVSCQLVHVGGDHSADSIVVYVPEDNILFLGDCMYPDIYNPRRRYTTNKLFPMLDQLLRFDAECSLAGHDPEPISRERMREETTLLQTIGHLVQRYGDDVEAIAARLQQERGDTVTDDDLELIGEFVAGLS
jgi:glyoxylase-like metal-dependent hydrolase (beta-lactamase superfamily II)